MRRGAGGGAGHAAGVLGVKNGEVPAPEAARVEIGDGTHRRAMDETRRPAVERLGERHGGLGAAAGADDVDRDLPVARLEVAYDRQHAIGRRGGVGRDGDEPTAGEQLARTDQEVAAAREYPLAID